MALWNKDKDKVGGVPTTPMSDIEMAMSRHEAERMYREAVVASGYNMPSSVSINDRRLTSNVYKNSADDISSESYRSKMLGMRLRLKEGERFPFDSIHTSLGKEKVFVFIVQNDKAATLEDDVGMFPSDTLVTQLRLIAK